MSQSTLKPALSAWHMWGIAVGLVISGEYFGWSYGWAQAGTLGFLITSVLVAAMYTTFIFSFTELTTAIPHAGGPLAYARRAMGPAANSMTCDGPSHAQAAAKRRIPMRPAAS